MEPLEQVTVFMTLMHRLTQVMEHERAVLKNMRLDALPELEEEKQALADAYEIELGRLRRSPDVLAALEPPVRAHLHETMRTFQEAVTANLKTLIATQKVVERVLQHVGTALARSAERIGYGANGQAERASGEVIPVAFNGKV